MATKAKKSAAKTKAKKTKTDKREKLAAPPVRPYLAPTTVAHEDDLTDEQVEAHRSGFGSQDIAGGAPGDDPRGPADHAANLRKGIERGDFGEAEEETTGEVADQLESEHDDAVEHTKDVEESGSQD